MNDNDYLMLQSRADAEHLADLAEINPNPWTGAAKELAAAQEARRKADELSAVMAFAEAYTAHRELFAQVPALDEKSKSLEAQRAAHDGAYQIRRHGAFMSSSGANEWTLESREQFHNSGGTIKALPPGFTQEQIDSMADYRKLDAECNRVSIEREHVYNQIRTLEERFPALQDLRTQKELQHA